MRTEEEAAAIEAAREKERIANLMNVAMQADTVGAKRTVQRCLEQMPRWAQKETIQAITKRAFEKER